MEIRLLDVEGKIIATTEGEFLLGLDTGKNQPYFLKGLEKTYVQDAGIFMHYGAEKEVLAIGTPLKARRRQDHRHPGKLLQLRQY